MMASSLWWIFEESGRETFYFFGDLASLYHKNWYFTKVFLLHFFLLYTSFFHTVRDVIYLYVWAYVGYVSSLESRIYKN